MIKDALEYWKELCQKAAETEEVAKGDPRAEHYLLDGVVINIGKPPSPRNHKINTLADLIMMAEEDADGGTYAVFYDEKVVTLIFDYDEYRVERATFALVASRIWDVVRGNLVNGPWFDGKALVRMLRTSLYGCLPDSDLADIVRRVKIEAGQVTSTDVFRGKESLGREIIGKVTAVAEIPDRVTLLVPVYSSLGETARYPLQCSVEIDPMRGNDPFQLKPLPDEIERVEQLAMQSIGQRLAAGLPEGCHCYYGSP